MKKMLLLFLLLPAMSSAVLANQVVLSVGNVPITSFDVQQMKGFQKAITQKNISNDEALRLLINLTALQILSENEPLYAMDEVELRKTINNITNNPSDPTAPQRQKLFDEYGFVYRLFLRSEKVKRGLMGNSAEIRAKVNDPVSEAEAKKVYNKNKALFQDLPYPKFDLIIFAVESQSRWSLAELTDVEESMAQIAKDLDKSSDFNAIRKKYPKLRFTKYSEKTGLYAPDILILQKKIPDEILGIALQPSIQLGTQTIKITKNKGIYIPQPIPFRSTGVPTYLTMKILDIVQPKPLTFAEALPRVEEMVKFERAEKAIDELIKDRIKKGQITLTPTGNTYQKVINEYN